MNQQRVKIGTSGFSYKDWLGNFYPQFCPQADFLKYYSSQFKTVEIDATFYRVPSKETVQKWAKLTPDDFVFSAKFPQTVTHDGNLSARVGNALDFIEVMKHLESKRGPLLLQFPYSFKPDQAELLIGLLEALPENGLFAVELRNKKWLDVKDVFELFCERNIAFCLIDHPWMPLVNIKTADFQYIRMLGDRKKIESDFSYVRFGREQELSQWAEIIRQWAAQDVNCFVYFNNHYSGHAPTTAVLLREILVQNT
ncbi:MAG: DUF72 domain-containing protein [Candidatus Zixiibacteriota bacterium]